MNRLMKAVLLTAIATAAAVTLASVAGARPLAGAATPGAPEGSLIAPLNLRSEEVVDRSTSEKHGKNKKNNGVATPVVSGTAVNGSNALAGWDGATMFDQRTLNGFYLEPPDQGMCVSSSPAVGAGGRVLEAVNEVVAIYNMAGVLAKPKQTLNSFFGYPGLNAGGPELADPSCYYDEETGAWFVAVLTLELNSAGGFTGANHIDLLVSSPSNHDPASTTWKRYTIPVQNNGTQGTPNHHCAPDPAPPPGETMPDACVGDYPHIGADKYGFYVTTNEYPFFAGGFNGAQIYALSKHKLAANESSVPWVLFENTKLDKEKKGPVGFTVWPAVVPGTAYNTENGGTEFFLSSTAGEESGNTTGSSNTIGLWAITNSRSLDTAHPDLHLSSRSLDSEAYGVPPASDQPGSGTQDNTKNWPLGQCLNNDSCATALLGAPDPFKPEVIGRLDSNDSRMQQVYYAAGKVWGALDTRLSVGGQERAGIAWFIVNPVMIGGGAGGKVGPQSSVAKQGYVGVANNNVTYPAVAVNTAGKGAMAFTIVGPDTFPGAANILIDLNGTHDPVFVAQAGVGLQDGFSVYKRFGQPPPFPRPRWGDYGAADEDGGSIWIASEYIGQQCTLAQYLTLDPFFGGCTNTRRALGNWYTRISHVTP